MRTALQSDLTVGDESNLFDPTTLDLAINRAYRKIGGRHKWEETRDALQTLTQLNNDGTPLEYYGYPTNWQTNSIWKLTINGTDYGDPLVFSDYNYEKENNMPSGFTEMFSNYSRNYFVYSTSGIQAGLPIKIWGYRSVDPMVVDGDPTIFSFVYPEINEAIVMEATSMMKNKGEILQLLRRTYVSGTELFNIDAAAIVDNVWARIQMERTKNAKTIPAWNVPDFFAHGITNRNILRNKIGQF